MRPSSPPPPHLPPVDPTEPNRTSSHGGCRLPTVVEPFCGAHRSTIGRHWSRVSDSPDSVHRTAGRSSLARLAVTQSRTDFNHIEKCLQESIQKTVATAGHRILRPTTRCGSPPLPVCTALSVDTSADLTRRGRAPPPVVGRAPPRPSRPTARARRCIHSDTTQAVLGTACPTPTRPPPGRNTAATTVFRPPPRRSQRVASGYSAPPPRLACAKPATMCRDRSRRTRSGEAFPTAPCPGRCRKPRSVVPTGGSSTTTAQRHGRAPAWRVGRLSDTRVPNLVPAPHGAPGRAVTRPSARPVRGRGARIRRGASSHCHRAAHAVRGPVVHTRRGGQSRRRRRAVNARRAPSRTALRQAVQNPSSGRGRGWRHKRHPRTSPPYLD